jgi:CO/xanthine dehydrogenase Mo-binding subunit
MDTPSIASIAAMGATGPYAIEAVDLQASPVYTNTCPTGSFRGPSGPQMVWATEAHMEEIAAQIALDPVELRRRNLLRAGDRGPTGELIRDPGIADCLDVVTERLERWRGHAPAVPPGRRRGYGLACAAWLTTGSPSGATLAMNEDGSATLATGGTEIGTGAVISGVAAIVAEELGLAVDQVRVASGSTDNRPHDGGSKGSRTMYGAGNAARQAAREVAQILAREVADHFEAAPQDVSLSDGRVGVRGSPEASLSMAEAVNLAFASSGPVVGKGRFKGAPVPVEGSSLEAMPFDAFNEPTFHCHGLELEVEVETGRIEVLRYVAAHDVGPVLNPVGARGQVEGGVVQGLGYALTESLDLSPAGAVRNADLVDYRIPTIADAPREIETVFVEDHPGPTGPFGAKGLGEPPVIVPAAAVGTALRDALGVQPDRLPFDAIRISDLLEQLALE